MRQGLCQVYAHGKVRGISSAGPCVKRLTCGRLSNTNTHRFATSLCSRASTRASRTTWCQCRSSPTCAAQRCARATGPRSWRRRGWVARRRLAALPVTAAALCALSMLKQADGPNRPCSCRQARSNPVKLGDTIRTVRRSSLTSPTPASSWASCWRWSCTALRRR